MVWYGPWQPGLVVTIRVGLQGNYLGQASTPVRGGVLSPLDGVVEAEVSRAESDVLYHEGWDPPLPEPYNGTTDVSEGTWYAMTRAGWNAASRPPQLRYDTSQVSSFPPSGRTIWEHAASRAVVSWEPGATVTPAPTSAEQTAAGAISWQTAAPPLVPESEVQPLEVVHAEFRWPGPGSSTEGQWLFLRRNPSEAPPTIVEDYANLTTIDNGADITDEFASMFESGESFGFHFVHSAAYFGVWPGWYGMSGQFQEGAAGSPEIHLTVRGRPWRWVFPGDEPVITVPYRRTSHRHDSLAGGATRNYPPSRALQTSNRIGGGYL